MNILVIGSGGREHALVWKISQSPRVKKIYCAPGNGGIAQYAECVPITADDIPALLAFARERGIDLTVVGPEVPLVAGIVDQFNEAGLKIFGPTRALARLEGSKIFSKELLTRFDIPTAAYKIFDDPQTALEYVQANDRPLVVKADGLCAGKGVIVCTNSSEAAQAVNEMMVQHAFGEAASRILVEECLTGEETSILILVDGKDFRVLPPSQDHKRIGENDTGLNTGGMGAYSPAPVITDTLMNTITGDIIEPFIAGLVNEGEVYKGVLYIGLMITAAGPHVLEFNVRFGDPETQAVLPRIQGDLVTALEACVDGTLASVSLEWDPRACVCVVLASGGYPGSYEKGKPITGLNACDGKEDSVVFHAGTSCAADNSQIVTSGGRVLGVTAVGEDIASAIQKVYTTIQDIHFDNMYYRKDIGAKALTKTADRHR